MRDGSSKPKCTNRSRLHLIHVSHPFFIQKEGKHMPRMAITNDWFSLSVSVALEVVGTSIPQLYVGFLSRCIF